jgi:hypothetical protein
MLPDSDTRQCITAAARALKLDPSARPVPSENYHMTLAFVGEVLESQLAPLLKVGGSQRARGFTVRFDTYEYWPKAQAGMWRQIHAGLASTRCGASEKGACVASNVCIRLEGTGNQSGAVGYDGGPVRLYSSRYLATTG